jgi:hypothetical protein
MMTVDLPLEFWIYRNYFLFYSNKWSDYPVHICSGNTGLIVRINRMICILVNRIYTNLLLYSDSKWTRGVFRRELTEAVPIWKFFLLVLTSRKIQPGSFYFSFGIVPETRDELKWLFFVPSLFTILKL